MRIRIALPVIVLAAAGCSVGELGTESSPGGDRLVGGTRLGFAYVVPQRAGDWNTTGWNDPLVRAAFERDLVILGALGARDVKLTLPPSFAGFDFGNGSATRVASELAAATTAVPDIIARLASARMGTQLTFLTNEMLLRSGDYFNDPTRPSDYETAYGARGIPAGPQAMGSDLYSWEDSIVRSVLDRGLGGALDYVNVATEVSYSYQRPGGPNWGSISPHVVQPLATVRSVPAGLRAADVLFPAEVGRLRQDFADAGAHLDVTEVHTYLGRTLNVNADIGAAVQQVRNELPGTRVVIGEFGVELCDNGGDENVQAQRVMESLDHATSAGVDLLVNWTLWDYVSRACVSSDNRDGHWGLGYGPDQPRNVMGRIVERQSALPGGDFETGTSGFTAGGGAGVGLVHGGPNRSDAATNQHYLRISSSGPGTYYACSPTFPIAGTRVATSAYVRSTSTSLALQLHYRDANGWTYETGRAPIDLRITGSATWGWRNIQSLLGGRVQEVPSGTTSAIACFVMDASAGPAYLDIDTVSINSY
jgi:hypothetical protein